jgi:hypothetical protein
VTSYLTEKLSKLRSFDRQYRRPQNCPFQSSFTQNCAVHSGNPTVSSVYLPTPRWHHLKAHPFLAIHSADEHRMIYSFSNTTSYSTFYAVFSSFRITSRPMWLANSKLTALFLSTIDTRTRRHPELTKKTDKPDGKPVLCQRTQFSFSCSFFLHS